MGRPKGEGKTPGSGRKPNTPNKITRDVREMLSNVIAKNTPRAIEILESSDDDKFMSIYMDLLEYIIPKLQRSDNTTEHTFKGSGLKIGYGDKGAE